MQMMHIKMLLEAGAATQTHDKTSIICDGTGPSSSIIPMDGADLNDAEIYNDGGDDDCISATAIHVESQDNDKTGIKNSINPKQYICIMIIIYTLGNLCISKYVLGSLPSTLFDG